MGVPIVVPMLEKVDRSYTKDEVMSMMEPLISTWFNERFDDLTIPQAKAIPVIHHRRSVLVSSPTGSGKTLTAFTSIINELTRYAREGTLEERVYCIYVSPLKALANDVNRYLNEPLAQMRELAAERGMNVPDIRVAVRSGDTPQSERQKMVRHPPHILITTPESLALILSAPKFSESFKNVEWVILDEIHDICDSKRGAFLSLTLERLRNHCEKDFVRIGLSATLAPIDAIASYLVGCNPDGTCRDVALIESGSKKKLDLEVICPAADMTALPSDVVNSMMYDMLKDLVDQHETTLVFTNTRSGAESVVYKLKERGLENIEVHHSSLGKEIRLDVEERLKRGEIKCVVSSTSLELGIDIGSVDLVCQIGSPKSVAKGLQRIGRSGHSFGKVAKGRLLVFDPDDLVECAVMCRAAHRGDIDRVGIPEDCLDVLSQTVVGMSLDRRWGVDEAYDLVKGSYCYRNLTKESFLQVLRYLGSKDDFEGVYSKIWYDAEEGHFGKKKGSRMIYFMNLGTIPEESNYRVVTNHGSMAGELSEKFVERLTPRDVFVLGGRSFEFVRTKGMTAYVKEANGRKPTVPSWAGEMLPRSFDLSMDIARFRGEMEERILLPDKDAIAGISADFDVDAGSARSILSYFREQSAVAGFIPDDRRLAIEEYIDPSGNQKLVFHYPFGRRVNDALSRAYAYRITSMIGANVSVTISDDSFMLGLPRKVDPAVVPALVPAKDLEQILRKAIRDSEIFKLRFRHTAARSFMILRNYMGRPISVNRQQIRSTYLLEALGNMDGVPVIEETYREVLEDDMDVKSARYVLERIESGDMTVQPIRFSGTPSPFAHSAILSGFSDIVLMEDRSALLRELHRKVLYRALGDAVSEFEFTEDQVVPYYAQKIPRAMSRDDIPKLLLAMGPLQAFRQRGRNVYAYTDEDKAVVDGWMRELINNGALGTVFLDDVHVMVASEIPYYAAATRKQRELNDADREAYSMICEGASMADVAEKLDVSDDKALRIFRKLESMYLITRTAIAGNNRWTYSKASFPDVDRSAAIDRIVMRHLECFAPTTVQEVAYALSLEESDVRSSLESLCAEEEVVKGRFLISETDQYMLKLDYMRLRSGKDNVYDYETVERYRLLKGERFSSIREYFEFYGSAGSDLDVYQRVEGFTVADWQEMRRRGELLCGRFVRGRVRFVLADDASRFAVLRSDEMAPGDERILDFIRTAGKATLRQITAATGLEKDAAKEAVMRIDRSLRILRAYDERGDWGAENTYEVYDPEVPGDDALLVLTERAIRAYGPVSATAMRFITGLSAERTEELAAEAGAETILVGEGQAPMLVMRDELPALEDVPDQEFPLRILSLSDPDLGSKWAEITSRYGDKWVYPVMKGDAVVGALEAWEMAGVVDIRGIDMDSPEMLPGVLDAVDGIAGYYAQKGMEVIRIREVLTKDAADLDEGMAAVLEEHGYRQVNGFYAKGRFEPWSVPEQLLIALAERRQGIASADRVFDVAALLKRRGYIRNDQEALIRLKDTSSLKTQLEGTGALKILLMPSNIGYATPELASLYRDAKGMVPDDVQKTVLGIISRKGSASKKEIIDASPYSQEVTSSAISELSRGTVIGQATDSRYVEVRPGGMTRDRALKEVAMRHLESFGSFTADGMASFLECRVPEARKVLAELEDDGRVRKGFFMEGDPVLRWMRTEDVGKAPLGFSETFVLNSQDILNLYLRDYIKAVAGSARSAVMHGTEIIGTFKGKVCTSGAKVEEFQGTDRARRVLKEAAQNVGVRLETERELEDDDWDVSEFYTKLNLGSRDP